MSGSLYRSATLQQGRTGKASWAALADSDGAWLLTLSTEGTARATIVFGQGEGVSRSPVTLDVPAGGTKVAIIGRPVEVQWTDTSGAENAVAVMPSRLDAPTFTTNYLTDRVYIDSPMGIPAPTPPPWARLMRVESISGVNAVGILKDPTGTPVAEIPANTWASMVGVSAVELLGTPTGYARVVYELVY